jgi:hypothetical protein
MNTLQQHQLWIGFGFVLFLIVFFMIAFFKAKTLTSDQRTILRLLGALCTGFAGALFTGDALFNMEGSFGAGPKFAIRGAAGAALFFVVWFFFPKAAGFPDAFNFSVPARWTFKQTVDELAKQDGAVPDYDGLTKAELSEPLRAWHLEAKDVGAAMRLLRSITATPNAIRSYEVKLENSVYYLRTTP